jgi:uncharacterized protein with HEPN domain
MKETDIIRLQHILDASRQAMVFSKNRDRSDLDNDDMLTSALIRKIEVIGEASTKISDNIREQLTEIPWRSIIAMRNMLIHAYDDINLDTLWYTVQNSIPKLIEELEKISEMS